MAASNRNYHEQVIIKNELKLRELQKQLPRFCGEFFRGIESTTSSRTRIAYAYDLVVFFNYLKAENPEVKNKDLRDLPVSILDRITATDIEEYLDYLKYYVTEDGKKVKGWVKHNSKWYYFSKNNGKMRKGFISVDKKKYYLSGSNGALRTGWIKVKGYRYLTKGDGSVIRNQAYSDGVKTYLFSKTGKKYTKGRHRIKGKMYYINKRTGTVINR